LHATLGNDELAESELQAARQAFVSLGDVHWEGQVVGNLAELAARRGVLDTADDLWSAASDLLAAEPDAAVVARRAAEAWVADGDVDRAHRWLVTELDMAERFEDGPALAWRTATAGALLNTGRGTEPGLSLLRTAVERYNELNDAQQATRVRLDLATALLDLGRDEDAVAELEKCLRVADQHSDRVLRQHTLANMGEIVRRNGELERALASLNEAVRLARDLNDDEAVAHVLGNLGLAQFEAGELDEARAAFTEQLRLAGKLRSEQHEASALGGLGNLDYGAGRYKKAAARYHRAADLHSGASAVREVEALGGWLASVASAGAYDELQAIGQRLVDAAQAADLNEKAAEAFSHTGRVLLRARDREGAADLYSVAVRLQLTHATGTADFEEEFVASLLQTLGLLAAHVEVELADNERQPFYDAVLADLDQAARGFGEQLRPYLDDVRAVLEEQGVFARLREKQGADD